ncbi:membrane protein [Microbispora corallina]|uniref:Membrane protein n=2 Tax=Microbispora corallina TaxID=83302 RepID=A0ABQ4FWJ8_9ACTN|nr:membrane protein [Microbispora corallina]
MAALAVAGLGGCGSLAAPGSVDMGRLRELGVSPDLVYLVDLPGHELAEQSLGVVNEEGFGAFYASPEGRQVELRVDRGTFDDEMCAAVPVEAAPPDAEVVCDHDDVGWYRLAGDRQEYVVLRGDALIRLSGRAADVGRAALKAAVAGARPATDDENATPPPARVPVERGDLPTAGDGAPNNEVAPGG